MEGMIGARGVRKKRLWMCETEFRALLDVRITMALRNALTTTTRYGGPRRSLNIAGTSSTFAISQRDGCRGAASLANIYT